MTTNGITVPQMAKELHKLIDEVQRIQVDEAVEWLKQNFDLAGEPPRVVNNVLAYGSAKGRNMWHREDDEMVAGPKAQKRVATMLDDNPAPQPETSLIEEISTPAEHETAQPSQEGLYQQFLDIGLNLNIDRKRAESTAYYVTTSYDMDDPKDVWRGIEQCSQIPGTLRRRWWFTWCNYNKLPMPDELLKEATSDPIRRAQETIAAREAGPAKKYAVNGTEIMMLGPNDGEGITLVDALALARFRQDNQKQPTGMADTALQVLSEAMKAMSENQTRQMELARADDSKAPLMESAIARMEDRAQAQDQIWQGRLEKEQSVHALSLQMIVEQNRAGMELLTKQFEHTVELLKANQKDDDKSPFTFVDQLFGEGTGQEMLKKHLSPSAQITLENKGTFSIEDYKTIKDLEMREEAIKLGKEAIPELLKAGRNIAEATREVAAQRGLKIGPAALKSPYMATKCVSCRGDVEYDPKTEMEFACPHCGVEQSADGRLLQRVAAPTTGLPEADQPSIPQETSEDDAMVPVSTVADEPILASISRGESTPAPEPHLDREAAPEAVIQREESLPEPAVEPADPTGTGAILEPPEGT